MARYLIRPATEHDEAFLLDMLHGALFVPPGGEPFPRSVLDRPDISHYVTGFGTRPGDVGFIAEAATGEPIGAAWIRLFTSDDAGYGYVDDETPELSMAVETEWRGHGVGTALLRRIIDTSPRISLSVDVRNPAARLYRRLGFTVTVQDGATVTMLAIR